MTEIHGDQVQFRNAREITLEKPIKAIYHITRLSRNTFSNIQLSFTFLKIPLAILIKDSSKTYSKH